MYKNRSQGFTLIELLVVIAIIGILSAVVLASLSTARQKGQDAAIQSDLATIQTQAEIYYGNTGNHYNADGTTALAWATTNATQTTAACAAGMFSNSTISNALAGAYTSAGSAQGTVDCAIPANGSTYIVGVKLMASTTGAWWCVDSTGVAKAEPYTAGSGGTASNPISTSALAACP